MPGYDGNSTIFGLNVQIVTADNPSAQQLNSFFGVNGMQSLFGGTRGRYTTVTGLLVGSDPASLNAAEELLRSYNDGIARVLVDSYGNAWSDVILDTFQPHGRIMQDADGTFFRTYKAGFRHNR